MSNLAIISKEIIKQLGKKGERIEYSLRTQNEIIKDSIHCIGKEEKPYPKR